MLYNLINLRLAEKLNQTSKAIMGGEYTNMQTFMVLQSLDDMPKEMEQDQRALQDAFGF